MERAKALLALAFGTVLSLVPTLPCAANTPAADHLRLRLVKVMDTAGFGQPMEAASLLVVWATTCCPTRLISTPPASWVATGERSFASDTGAILRTAAGGQERAHEPAG